MYYILLIMSDMYYHGWEICSYYVKTKMENATSPSPLSITCYLDCFLINILFITIIKEQWHALSWTENYIVVY